MSTKPLTPKQTAFIEALREYVTIKNASIVAGVTKTTHYEWLKNSETYKKAYDAIEEERMQSARDELADRALFGHLKIEYDGQGNPTKATTGYETGLSVAYARANLPEYRETKDLNVNVETKTIKVDNDKMKSIRDDVFDEEDDDAEGA